MRTQLLPNDEFFLPPAPSPLPPPPFPDLFSSFPLVSPPTAAHSSFPSSTAAKSAFDLVTLSFIAALLLLSLLSLSFIFYLRLKSRRFHHLENFNSLWAVRLLLVLLSSVWAINEILRLPLVRRNRRFSLQQQADICKIHIVLSLGLIEPSFLVTLLFLVNVSIKKKNPSRMWALASLFMVCAPMTLLQTLFVFFSPFEGKLPRFVRGSSVPSSDVFGNSAVLCTYPFFSCVVFGGFTIIYAVVFLVSCWRVMALAINKGMRRRINSLAAAVMVALSAQVAGFSLSWMWMPEDKEYGIVVLAMFLFVLGSMVIGEVILVIKPIMDALTAGGDGGGQEVVIIG